MTQAPPPLPDRQPAPRPASPPGGLIALAILNFIFGALALILALVFIATIILKVLPHGANVPADVLLLLVISVLLGALLIVSGIGYLKRSHRMGRVVGNVYSVISVILILGSIAMGDMPAFGIIFWPIYPVVTLVLLNGRFRKVFR